MSENQKVILYKAGSTGQFPENYHTRFHTHIYCHSGTVKFMFNGRLIHCKEGEFIFWLAGLNISDVSFASNFKATILFVDKELLTGNLPSANASIDSYVHSKENPFYILIKTIGRRS